MIETPVTRSQANDRSAVKSLLVAITCTYYSKL